MRIRGCSSISAGGADECRLETPPPAPPGVGVTSREPPQSERVPTGGDTRLLWVALDAPDVVTAGADSLETGSLNDGVHDESRILAISLRVLLTLIRRHHCSQRALRAFATALSHEFHRRGIVRRSSRFRSLRTDMRCGGKGIGNSRRIGRCRWRGGRCHSVERRA